MGVSAHNDLVWAQIFRQVLFLMGHKHPPVFDDDVQKARKISVLIIVSSDRFYGSNLSEPVQDFRTADISGMQNAVAAL